MAGELTAMPGTRDLSAAIFNNDKFVEVVLALDSENVAASCQEIADRVGINHGLARKVLVRLQAAELVKPLPRIGGRRGVVPWEVQRGPEWAVLVAVCHALFRTPGD